MRGDVFWLNSIKRRGHEQSQRRPCVVVQSSDLPLSTWVVVPTSTSATPVLFRPSVTISGTETLVLTEHVGAIDPEHRLGERIGRLTREEMQRVDAALRLVLSLD